jgi:hypothetical protein
MLQESNKEGYGCDTAELEDSDCEVIPAVNAVSLDDMLLPSF